MPRFDRAGAVFPLSGFLYRIERDIKRLRSWFCHKYKQKSTGIDGLVCKQCVKIEKMKKYYGKMNFCVL